MPTVRVYDREYVATGVFLSESDTNAFLELCPGHGVIAEIGGVIYTARLDDQGVSVRREIA